MLPEVKVGHGAPRGCQHGGAPTLVDVPGLQRLVGRLEPVLQVIFVRPHVGFGAIHRDVNRHREIHRGEKEAVVDPAEKHAVSLSKWFLIPRITRRASDQFRPPCGPQYGGARQLRRGLFGAIASITRCRNSV